MRKKILSTILALCLALSLLPTAAFATGETTVYDEAGLKSAIANAQDGDTITLGADIAIDPTYAVDKGYNEDDDGPLDPCMTIDDDITLNLANYKLSWNILAAQEHEIMYTVCFFNVDGASLTLTGESTGSIDTEFGMNNSYGINIENNGSVTVNDGTYTGATTAIQVEKGTLTILGGTFKQANTIENFAPSYAKYVINCIDASFKDGTARIYVKGGTFCFDPDGKPEASDVTYVPADYESKKDAEKGTWTVTKKHNMTVEDGNIISGTVSATVSGVTIPGSGDITTDDNTLTIDAKVSGAFNVTGANVTVGGEALKAIDGESSVTNVVIKTDVGDMTLDQDALNSIIQNASVDETSNTVADVVLSMEKTGSIDSSNTATTETYTLTAVDTATNEVYADGRAQGKISISIPYEGAETACVYYVSDNGPVKLDADAVTVADDTLTWTVEHFSKYIVTQNESNAFVVDDSGTTAYPDLAAVLDNLDSLQDAGTVTIRLLDNSTHELDNADYEIDQNVTITGNATINATVKKPVTSGNTTTNYHAFTVMKNASLTLDGVTLNITGQGYGIDVRYGAELALENSAVLNFQDLKNATISAKTNITDSQTGKFNITDSTITANKIGGNFSNGGAWTITDSTVTIDGCENNALSADTLTINHSDVDITNVGYRGIIVHGQKGELNIIDGSKVSVTDCCNTTDQYADTYADKSFVQLNSKDNATINFTLDADSSLNVDVGNIQLDTAVDSKNSIAMDNFIGSFYAAKENPVVAMIQGGRTYTTLAEAITAAQSGNTITLLGEVTVSDKVTISKEGITLDGNRHSITVSTEVPSTGDAQDIPPVNSVLEVTANNVTIQDVELIDGATAGQGKVKHGVQFYNAEGGRLSNVTVTNTAWTGVLVNGSDVTIENSALNPSGDKVYATIEYSMGEHVTRIPKIALENVTTDDPDGFLVWADNDTVKRVIEHSSNTITTNNVANAIRNNITTKNNVSITVRVKVDANENPVDTTVPSTKPSTGGSGGGGGSSSTTYSVTAPGNVANGDVTVSPSRASYNSTVTITVTPDEGYVLDTLTVTDRNGKEIDLTKVSDTKYTFKMPRSAVEIEATFAEEEQVSTLPFIDVNVDDWFYEAVAYAYENGIMDGVGSDKFAPNSTLTRGMMVTVLYRMEGEPDLSDENLGYPFADVDAASWYGDAVYWARLHGIVNGVSETAFAPGSNITREQLATMLYRYAQYKGCTTTGGSLTGYRDAADVSDYAETALGWAVNAGLVNGIGDNTLLPLGTATRAQAATMLMRFAENVID